jgi:quercetin dioxygenase-like cupin family protein
MKSVFPEMIRSLPIAEIPLEGVTAFISQAEDHQILFMEFGKDVEVPSHSHGDQWGMVLAGSIDLTVAGQERTYGPGDNYFIPAGAEHSARIHAGYADVTFFADPHRYKPK